MLWLIHFACEDDHLMGRGRFDLGMVWLYNFMKANAYKMYVDFFIYLFVIRMLINFNTKLEVDIGWMHLLSKL